MYSIAVYSVVARWYHSIAANFMATSTDRHQAGESTFGAPLN
jgi:hypothetical protein